MDFRRFVYTMIVKKTKKPNNLAVVRSQVKALLTRSQAFHSLPPDGRRQIARDMVRVVNYLVSDASPSANNWVAEVDFPDFVSNLINSVFDAIVDASIKQMEAYAKLVAGVAKSVDKFRASLSDKEARDYLVDRFPYFFRSSDKTKRPRVRLASNRQQMLATMVLMGINRIVVTDGKIPAKI